MTRATIIWLGIVSFIVTMLIWFFHGYAFSACYAPFTTFQPYTFLPGNFWANCIISTSIFSFALLFLFPIAITLIIYAGYVILFDRAMPFSKIILWFCWFVMIYFLYFQFSF